MPWLVRRVGTISVKRGHAQLLAVERGAAVDLGDGTGARVFVEVI